jgi:hypothetical protein
MSDQLIAETFQHKNHNRETSVPTVRLEPTISADERPQTYALACGVTASTGFIEKLMYIN